MSVNTYQPGSKLDKNSWITPPTIPDPQNLPEPLGWTLLVRPYPVKVNDKRTSLIIPDTEIDFMNYLTNIGRVVAVGPCCWARPEHRKMDGTRFEWVKVGDFISYPKNVGARRKFKDVSFVLLCDDDVVEKLPDPQVFDNDFYTVDIPDEDLKKYNSIYNESSAEHA